MLRKCLLALGVSVLLGMLSGTFLQRHALACELLPVLDYQQLRSSVYAEPGMSAEQAALLTGLLELAFDRIEALYGTPVSAPRFIITSNAESALAWGANETASMHRLPWRSCIVIGPKGQNVDVVAHEWLHAEIQQRVGFMRLLKEIPVWFDEGAALTVDHRAPFLPENIELTAAEVHDVTKRASARAFFSGDIRSHYQAARLAVEPLIVPEQFYADLGRIAAGESFAQVFLSEQQ
ncbi:hypothetical protein [Alkalimonas amylolytica]|uniref:Peptidase MA superfamily protein n=1 Tax=Alkalimonas amylolytica TaxID=152573 RepID=A0A1H3Z8V6_ALKAM|nr:hypothetical protein [Alkalimonas amylolytica]SEA19958.1 hypothetical protein SAMN04488051_10270 [Alkalimonas amylolytica]